LKTQSTNSRQRSVSKRFLPVAWIRLQSLEAVGERVTDAVGVAGGVAAMVAVAGAVTVAGAIPQSAGQFGAGKYVKASELVAVFE
jgi:hypothetical protein